MAGPRYHDHEYTSLIEFGPPQPSRTIGIVRAKGKFQTLAAKVFIEALHHLATARQEHRKCSLRKAAKA